MKFQNIFWVITVSLLPLANCFSQSYAAQSLDNYGGIHSVLLNPAEVINPNLRADINLLSFSTLAGSDYFGISLNSALNGDSGFNFESDANRYPKDNNQFFLNADILGPSFMFNLSSRHSIGLTSRLRAFMNFNNINGILYENVDNNFEVSEDFDFLMKDFSGTLHVWGELGLTYGRVLINTEDQIIKAGVTLKLLQGAGSTFFQTPQLSGEYNANLMRLATSGSLMYSASQDFDSDEIKFDNLSSGLGADFGFTYISKNKKITDSLVNSSNYKFKIGLSVTDLGKISYKESEVNSYNLNKTVDREIFEAEDIETILMENYDGTQEVKEIAINLPAAAHLMVDFQVRKRIYVSLLGNLSLVSETKAQANRTINSLTLAPRLQMRWLSLYLPVSIRQYDGLVAGAGLRLGPLTIGSGSAINNLLSDDSKSIDIYGGLKFPLYKK